MDPELEYTRFRACTECRRRRIKCDGRVSGCRPCLNLFVKCVYDTPARPTRRRVDTTSDLDRRLGRIESAIKQHLATRLSVPPVPPVPPERGLVGPVGPVAPVTPGPATRVLYAWKIASERPAQRAPPSDGGLVFSSEGQVKFIGDSSVFSVFLPNGMQWIREKMGKRYFYDPLSCTDFLGPTTNPLENTLIDVPGGCKSLPAPDAALPSRSAVTAYVNAYFDRVNCAWPIFDRAHFTAELERSYQPGSRPPLAWRLALYMVLALGCVSDPAEEPAAVRTASQVLALSYFRTGCQLLPGVLFCNREISGVQALLATILFLWETPSTNGCCTLIGVAASMGSELGLHRSGAQLQLPDHIVDLRRNVFWVTYILDKEISLRMGRASSIQDHDITVGPPRADIPGCTPRVLLQRVQLARIQADVSHMLCMRVNTTQSDAALQKTVNSLLADLQAWKTACAAHVEPCREPVAALHALWLQLAYLSCLGAITRPLSPVFEGTALLAGSATSLHAARATVNLISAFEQRGLKLQRSTGMQLLSAQITLFTHVLDNPRAASVTADMRDVHRVVEYLLAGAGKGCPGVSPVWLPAETLYNMAAGTVERARSGIGVQDLEEEDLEEEEEEEEERKRERRREVYYRGC